MINYPEQKIRCPWPGDDPLMVRYHDEEWGTPLHDERKHFEFLLLETMQAGLSWKTILHKREAFRRAFFDFDPVTVSQFSPSDIDRLMEDSGIIRYRKKLEAGVHNAGCFLRTAAEFGSFDSFIWSFTGGKVIDHRLERLEDIPVKDELAERVTKALKERDFKFVGAVTVYAHLQAIGVINDHLISCFRH